MSLNVWGMPSGLFGGLDKRVRIQAIGSMIMNRKFHVYLIQELWLRQDHETLRSKAHRAGYYMTTFDQLNDGCRGIMKPKGCSGLAVISWYPIEHVYHEVFFQQGWGEEFYTKGWAKIRIRPVKNMVVDLLDTHLCGVSFRPGRSNKKIHLGQAKQILKDVHKSHADFYIVGGDFNTYILSKSVGSYDKIIKVVSK